MIIATSRTLVEVRKTRRLTREGHDVGIWVMQKWWNIDAEGLGDADLQQILWNINAEVSGDVDFEQILWNIDAGVLGGAALFQTALYTRVMEQLTLHIVTVLTQQGLVAKERHTISVF